MHTIGYNLLYMCITALVVHLMHFYQQVQTCPWSPRYDHAPPLAVPINCTIWSDLLFLS